MDDGRRDDSTADERVRALLEHRVAEYARQWDIAATKLRRSEYHAEDLIDDCFRLWGNAMRDATAVATLLWRAAEPGRRRMARRADISPDRRPTIGA